MNVLLLTSPAPDTYQYGFYLGEKRFPLGLASIAAVLETLGHTVKIIDLYAGELLTAGDYDLIGVYANTICFKNGTLPLLKQLRSFPGRPTLVVGGPHTSVLPETIPDYVDHVVIGEGEAAIEQIVKQRPGRIVDSPRIEDLDSLPRPAYHLLAPIHRYNLTFDDKKSSAKRVFTYSSSRGCPFSCKFCSSSKIFNRKWTAHSPERMLDDIQFLQAIYEVDGIYFREDNFTVNMNRVREFCELLLVQEVNVEWKCETRVDVNRDDLQLMHKAGLRSVYVGLESGSERILELINKKINLAQVKRFVGNCNEIGIRVYGSFIRELPFETKEELHVTRKFGDSLKLDRANYNKYLALPGSPLYDEVKANPELLKRYKTILIDENL